MSSPVLSVCLITYNHVNYIRKAIDGVLIQKVNFPFELIIADDFSSDGTRDIVVEYKKKYPDFIKLILQKKNVGPAQNYIDLITSPKSKYIAYFEGDDYWTDPHKLQMQVDFLDGNPDYSACAHQAKVIYANVCKQSHLFRDDVKEVLHLNDMLNDRVFHTASLLFRAHITQKHPIPSNIVSADRALFLLLASYGPIRFMPDIMCVYRKNEGGMSSRVTAELLKNDLNMLPWICSINPKFPKKRYKSFIYKTIFDYPPKVSLWDIAKYYVLHVLYSFSFFPKNIRPLLVLTIKTLPQIIKAKR